MGSINLTPEVIKAYKEVVMNPNKYGFGFTSLEKFFEKSDKVTAKDVLAKQYLEHIKKPLPKVILYIIMDEVFNQCSGKDTSRNGNLGYYLKLKETDK